MRLLITPALVCTALLSACSAGTLPRATTQKQVAPTLLLATSSGVEAVAAAGGDVRYRVADGVATADGSSVMAVEGTELVVRDARTGATRQRVAVGAGLVVSTISPEGRFVALTTVALSKYLPAGRTTTGITIVQLPGGRVEPYRLQGNFAPDAFTADGTGLFLVSYLPSSAPDRYQITYLDFSTGQVSGVFGRQKEALEDMRGVAGMRTLSPDRTALYTLYLRPPNQAGTGSDTMRAEVHTLKLDQYWAYCVDLPADFGGNDLKASALAVSPGGHHLYVVDRAVRRLVEVDTDALAVSRSVLVPLSPTYPSTAIAVGGDGHMYLSDGSSIVVLRTDTLAVSDRWPTQGPITGLALASDGGVIASSAQHVEVFGPGGRRQATTAVPSDATAISRVLP